MEKEDLKKIKHIQERTEIVNEIKAIKGLKYVVKEKKDELIQSLLDKKGLSQIIYDGNVVSLIQNLLDKKGLSQISAKRNCPFPQHQGYLDLWEIFKNKPKLKKYMKENIRISTDGKIEIIKMKKKFSLLQAEHDGETIFEWEYKDTSWKKWIKWVTYLRGCLAEKMCEKQKKELLNNKAEVEEFISYFPWESTKEKILSLVKLFGLKKTGSLFFRSNCRYNINEIGYVGLSKVGGYINQCGVHFYDNIHGIRWKSKDIADLYETNQRDPMPYIVYEDC